MIRRLLTLSVRWCRLRLGWLTGHGPGRRSSGWPACACGHVQTATRSVRRRRRCTGTYFQMIYPGGTVANGKFFDNPDSTCANKAYTLAVPGVQGGLVTGKYQPNPTPAFNAQGGALADGIVQPQSFTAIDFSIATDKKDPQSGLTVPPPTDQRRSGQAVRAGRSLVGFVEQALLQPGLAQAERLAPGADRATLRDLQLEHACVRDHVDEPGGRRAV